MKICIVGAGWYGIHLFVSLHKQGYEVVLFEKSDTILNRISGNFGIRLHTGLHYPRSRKTRENCQKGFEQFNVHYPDLIVEHEYSIYALGEKDENGFESKVSVECFKNVCHEANVLDETYSPEEWGYKRLLYAAKVEEPSIMLGEPLRNRFFSYLKEKGLEINYNTCVSHVEVINQGVRVYSYDGVVLGDFDYLINATSYQDVSLIGKEMKLFFEVKYQTCIAFTYRDKEPTSGQPFSFIIMDGFFPCIMPYHDNEGTFDNKYILTNGKWTILGTFENSQSAYLLLSNLTDTELEMIRIKCEKSIINFWPTFEHRFEYLSWKGSVLAKPFTEMDFRSAVTFSENKYVIHILPGKVSNIFDVEEEINQLINNEDTIENQGITYVKGGVLDEGMEEITLLPDEQDKRNTCNLQTYEEIKLKNSYLFFTDQDESELDNSSSNSNQI